MDDVTSKYHVRISSKVNHLSLNLKEVWQYKDLIVLFTKRSFALTYKQTILGPAWIFLNPFITSIIFTFIFGQIAGISTDGIPHILFYLSSNAIWALFSASVTKNAHTFTSNAGVFGKVYFPRLTIPVSNVLSTFIQFLVQMSMILVFWLYYYFNGSIAPHIAMIPLIPLILLHLGLLGLGFGIIISSMTTKYRDLAILVNFGVQLWMYITPVVYPISQIGGSGKLKALMMLNPVTAPVEAFRYILLGSGTFDLKYLCISWIITIIIVVFGVMIFNTVEKTFMDTV